jgi:pimeloyl-ACP methyl ester carboxylesterase
LVASSKNTPFDFARLGIAERSTKNIRMTKIMAVIALGMLSGAHAFASSDSDVFFIVMGGRTSCGSGSPAAQGTAMNRPFQAMLGHLKNRFRQRKFSYLVSCLDTEAPPGGQARFFTSDQPNFEERGNADELVRQTELFTPSRAVFVIGHSYGGFLAMYVAQNLRIDRPLDGLFTVDPISPNCGPGGVVFGSQACHSAPSEMDNDLIRRQTKRWINYFQDQDTWINSSAISEAENLHIQYRGPHNRIDLDRRTWESIEAAVRKALK